MKAPNYSSESEFTELAQSMRIERVIHRSGHSVEAEFYHLTPDGRWLCCTAWIPTADPFRPLIQGRNTAMTPEQAHVAMTGFQMAITWVFQEKGRRDLRGSGMLTLAESLPAQINRVREIQDQYKSLRGTPNVCVDPQIRMMEQDLQQAIRACAEGDVVAMIAAHKSLEGWTA